MSPSNVKRALTVLGLVIGIAVLGFELWLQVGRRVSEGGLLNAGLRYVTFFTNLSNLLVVLVYAAELAPRERRPELLVAPVTRATALAMILLTMTIYYFILSKTENPQGLAKASSVAAHYIAPALYLLWWWLYARRGVLEPRHVPAMLVVPVNYMAVVLVLGHITGRYPYSMLNADRLSAGAVALHGIGLLVALVLLCLAIIGLDRLKTWGQPTPLRPRSR